MTEYLVIFLKKQRTDVRVTVLDLVVVHYFWDINYKDNTKRSDEGVKRVFRTKNCSTVFNNGQRCVRCTKATEKYFEESP